MFRIHVDLERSEGRFASKDELAELITEALEDANPGDITAEDGGAYTVSDWVVERAK